MAAKDIDGIQRLLSEDFVLDYVHADASQETPISAEGTRLFWPAWFAAFTESDFEGTRTIVAAEVVVTQWIFTGTHDGRLEPLAFDPPLEPTGRTIRFLGASFYDISDGLIQRETLSMDLATLMVELGADL